MAKKKDKTYKKLKQQEKQKSQKKQKVKTYATVAGFILVIIAIFYLLSMVTGSKNYVPKHDDRPSIGPEDSKVVFLEFGCYTCPFTKQFNLQVVNQLIEEYGDRVKFTFRSVPIARNIGSETAALAAKCADDQGKFWEFSDLVFASNSYTTDTMVGFANQLELDGVQFRECLSSRKYEAELSEDISEARKAAITVTPTVFINNVRINGVHDISLYRRVLDDMLAETSN